MKNVWIFTVVSLLCPCVCLLAQSPKQPRVAPGPGEPDWENDDFQDVVCHIDNVTLIDEPVARP